jgi:serine/threonine protein kinase
MSSALLADRYQLEEVLSTTVMAQVHTATDLLLDRPVIVKLLAPGADWPRFEREARAVAVLAHPNIVQLFDYGEENQRPYMVLEYLPGGSLAARLADSTHLPDDETTRVAIDIAAGLAHAHERGVVHRDLKPGNVLYDAEGRAKIADFGIAKLAGADTLTDAGTILGTVAYISPEQTRGEPATPASDVYSFGVVLYRMLAGRLPFEGSNAPKVVAMHQNAEPAAITSVRPDVPAALAAVAMAALAKVPAARPRDGTALLHAIESPKRSGHRSEAETQVMRRTTPRHQRLRRPLIATGILSLLAVAGVTAGILTRSPTSTPALPLETSRPSSSSATQTARGDSSNATTSRPSSVTSSKRENTTPSTSLPAPASTPSTPAQPTSTTDTTTIESTSGSTTTAP